MAAQAGKSKKDIAPPPTVKTRDGREIPIRTVRVRKVVRAVGVGQGPRTRYVKPGANHHSVIVAVLDKDGKEKKWEDHPVTRLEVHQRKAARQPIIQKDWGVGRRFKFSLSADDYLLVTDGDGQDKLVRLLSLSEGAYEGRIHYDARAASEARKKGSGARVILAAESMRKRNARKVRVTYLGEIVASND